MPEQTTSIYDSLFGTMPATQNAAAERDARFQDLLNARKKSAETQRTSDTRMAQFAAIGNALTTMVQPLGWAAGGATGGVQPYDSRQYLESFNRALRDADNVRNVGNAELEYQFKLADDAYKREVAKENQVAAYQIAEAKSENTFRQRAALYQLQHQMRLEEIDRRADAQLELARVRNNFQITKNGVPIDQKMLSTAWTQYVGYLKTYRQDIGRGLDRTEVGSPLSFDQFLGTSLGGGYTVTPALPTATQTQTPADAATQPATQTQTQTQTPAAPPASSPAKTETKPPKGTKSGGFHGKGSGTATKPAGQDKSSQTLE